MQKEKIIEYKEVLTRNGYGFFPEFDKIPTILHGFKWGDPYNIFYTRETGYPSEEAIEKVKMRVIKFLHGLEMNTPPKTVIFAALPGLENVCYLDEESLNQQQVFPNRGYYLESGAVFTKLKGLSIYAGLGDCSFTTFYGDGVEPVIGLIHGGRAEITRQSPKNTLKETIIKYHLNPNLIKLGISPYLGPKYHIISSDRYNQLPMGREWEQFSYKDKLGIHLDMGAYLVDQYCQIGIPQQNIEIYKVDTYISATKGLCYSHRFDMNHNQPTSRIGIAIQLK